MSMQPVLTPMLHRLDKALFWLRWGFIVSAVLLLVLAEETILGEDIDTSGHLPVGLGIAITANIVLGILALLPNVGERLTSIINLVVDSLLAVTFFWVFEGAAAPLVLLGTLAILPAVVRFRWSGIGAVIVLVLAGSLLAAWQIDHTDNTTLTNLILSVGMLCIFGVLGAVLVAGGWSLSNNKPSWDQRVQEAFDLRIARERANAIYDMATTLSASLDHRHVLESAQAIGALALRDLDPNSRLISAVLLFQGEDNRLHVVTSRGLTRADEQVIAHGRRGVLGMALKQSEPVFAADAIRDPELRYFVAFQDSKSLLAIPLRAGFETYGVIVFGSDKHNAFSGEDVDLLTALGTQATIALQNAVLYQNLAQEKERIVEVDEDARKKLARDLHDGPTQVVAAIAMRVNYIRRLIERQPEQATEELWKVEEMARRTTKEIRHMLFTLRPLVLETQGMIAALRQLAEKMRDTYDTHVVVKAQPSIADYMDTHHQGVLFYIVEEAVNNARKHAQAETITVRLYRRDDLVVTEIEDNGVGFDVGKVEDNYEQRGSLGMVNMRERAALIEGTLRIQSAAGRGTKISIVMPIDPAGIQAVDGEETIPAPPLQLQSQHSGTRGVRRLASPPQPKQD
ncbi:MAG: GAF domain-containing sensor histidine kinase [Anaerolineae bacterium]|nr:GAF domain-containing sensor histidine kinase [Anaerolineae bacterium]